MGFKEKSNCIKDSVYIDDGFSGTHFDNRPQFTEMIGLAQKGEINCIIVKDFSRFGRDYVELGNYLEQLFPFMGVRFISVKNKGELERVIVEGKHQPIVTKEEYERVQKMMAEKDAQMGQRRKNKGVHSEDLWRRKMRCQCGHAFAKTKWHTKTDFITYTYKCYDQTRTGTIAARLKNGLSIENVCRSPLVQDWKMYTMAQYGDVEPATEADVSGKLENLRRLMEQPPVPEDGEFSEEEMDKYVSGVRVYEDRFEWLLNLSPDAGGGLDDAGSPVYFKKITVTPDDERAWFRKHPQWSKSNRYAELEAWIFI